jgi:hypothetical protein
LSAGVLRSSSMFESFIPISFPIRVTFDAR